MSNTGTTIADLIAEDESQECRAVRPDTMGYQRCMYVKGHDGEHRSQDREAFPA